MIMGSNGSVLRVLRGADVVEALGQRGELVTVAHPHLEGIVQTLEQSHGVLVLLL